MEKKKGSGVVFIKTNSQGFGLALSIAAYSVVMTDFEKGNRDKR